MSQITPMVKQLLILNIIFFIGMQFVPQANAFLALHYFQSPLYKPWQWFTYMFMHANMMHILFNMFGLFLFGSLLERIWGERKFLFFYITCGLVAALVQTGVNYWQIQQDLAAVSYLNLSYAEITSIMQANCLNSGAYKAELLIREILPWLQHKPGFMQFVNSQGEGAMALLQAHVHGQSTMVGASGAIYGLTVAFAVMFPNAKMSLLFLPIGIPAKFFIPLLLCYDLFSGFSSTMGTGGSNVAHFAHLGGALAGFLLMLYWKKNQFNQNRWN